MICCSNEGEIRGYKFSAETATIIAANIHKDYQEAVRELAQKKKVKKKWLINKIRISNDRYYFLNFKILMMQQRKAKR